MTSDAVASGNVCYRHPDRQSYILCQRCGRTICSQCQTQAPVGVHCPECVREARASAPRTKPAIVSTMTAKGAPVVTYTLIALCVIVFAIELLVPAAPAVPAVLPAAHPGVPVGTRHLDVQPLGRIPAAHPLQHAHAVPVRPRARTDARPRALPRALPAERARRIGRRHAAAARWVGDRRIRCDLRSARRVLRDPTATRVLQSHAAHHHRDQSRDRVHPAQHLVAGTPRRSCRGCPGRAHLHAHAPARTATDAGAAHARASAWRCS